VDGSLEEVLCWFGPPGEHGVETLQSEGLLNSGNQALRQAYLDRVGPLLQEVGVELHLGRDQQTGRWEDQHLPWDRWNRLQRRLEPARR
jgi:1,2-phenylacetyl-CoA epoxidase catalytic subunit